MRLLSLYFLIPYIVLSSFHVYGQYEGGNGDGYSSFGNDAVVLSGTNSSAIYSGGDEDGSAVLSNTSILLDGDAQILFGGGSSDGFGESILQNLLIDGLATIVFAGGNGDGFDKLSDVNIFLKGVDPMLAFNGGNADGFDGTTLENSLLGNLDPSFLFTGGNGDGYGQLVSANKLLGGINGTSIFSSGDGDGFDELTLANSLLGIDNTSLLFSGGSSDGFDQLSASNIFLTGDNPILVYGGGNADGFNGAGTTGRFINGSSSSIVFGGGNADGFVSSLEEVRTLNFTHRPGSGKSIEYNGSTQYINVGDDPSLNITNGTIEFWFKPDWVAGSLGGTNPMVVGKRTTGNTQYAIHVTDDLDAIGLHDGSTFGTVPITFVQGEWYHVSFTDVGTDTNVTVNGVPIGSTGNAYTSNTGAPFNIGSNDGNADFFDGEIDEVRIWDAQLSTTNIRDWMNVKLTNLHPEYANLVGYWRFDEGNESVTKNWAGGTNGTLINSPTWVTSGAMLGDQSVHDFSAPTTLSLNVAGAGELTVDIVGGTADGIQIYYIGESPENITPPANFNNLDNKYFGVFVVGNNPFYTLTYDYSGNTIIGSESNIQLAYRSNNADTWINLGGIIDTGANTITQSGLNGTEFILGGTSNPLPVTLLSFTADVIESSDVLLHWRTATEINNNYFQLERSSDGVLFNEVVKIQGSGNSHEEKQYQYIDRNATVGLNYYRLKQFDFDGKTEVLKILPVEIKALNKHISIYPNPASSRLNVTVERIQGAELQFELTDLQGKKYSLEPVSKEGYIFTFRLNNLLPGVYVLSISNSGTVIQQKLLVEHN